MLVNIEICSFSTLFDIALIQWYDFFTKMIYDAYINMIVYF